MALEIVINLILTILIETIVLLILNARYKIIMLSVLINIITNVSINLIIFLIAIHSILEYILTVVILEAIVIIVETFYYYIITKQLSKSIIYGVVCNIGSYFIGLIIQLITNLVNF